MKEYKIITGYATSESVEAKMNDYAKIGYVLDSFKTFEGGSYSIVIIMSRVKEPQTYLRRQALGAELKDISNEFSKTQGIPPELLNRFRVKIGEVESIMDQEYEDDNSNDLEPLDIDLENF